MFIGYWNKSVILTYLSIICSMIGMFFLINSIDNINYSICLLMAAGIFDLFDGFVARKCKRTKDEKEFGVQLDSLADVISFVVYPVLIMLFTTPYKVSALLVGFLFGICGICRLGYFNLSANSDGPVKLYSGLPVTFIALLAPIFYLLKYVLSSNVFGILYILFMLLVAVLFVLNIKIPKPKGKAYIIFSLLFIIFFSLYMVVLK